MKLTGAGTGVKALGFSLVLGLACVSMLGLSACGQVNSQGGSGSNYSSYSSRSSDSSNFSGRQGGFTPLNLSGKAQEGVNSQSIAEDSASPSALNTAPGPAGIVGQGDLLAAQARHGVKEMVTATVQVKRLLPGDRKGLPHQKFLLQLENGTTVLVAHNTDQAPQVPVSPGDYVTIHGEYIWNAKGGLIHWTHHSDTYKHEGGWIDFGGRRYE